MIEGQDLEMWLIFKSKEISSEEATGAQDLRFCSINHNKCDIYYLRGDRELVVDGIGNRLRLRKTQHFWKSVL